MGKILKVFKKHAATKTDHETCFVIIKKVAPSDKFDFTTFLNFIPSRPGYEEKKRTL